MLLLPSGFGRKHLCIQSKLVFCKFLRFRLGLVQNRSEIHCAEKVKTEKFIIYSDHVKSKQEPTCICFKALGI